MYHPIIANTAQYMKDKLLRSSIQNAAEWALNYRMIRGKKWTFDRHPWLYEPHLNMDPTAHSMKAAQLGYTEWLMNLTFMIIDIFGESVLYGLPDGDSAKDFSSGRFDPALQENPLLQKMFSDTKNVGMKRAGAATLYVRGARSPAKLKSIPTAGVIMDEIDEWMRRSIDLALERASGQFDKWIRSISTPSVAGVGIHKLYSLTTMSEFMFKCPSCNKWELLTFDPEDQTESSIFIPTDDPTSKELLKTHLRCKKTLLPLHHEDKSSWLTLGNTKYVAEHPDRMETGWHCSQLYSHTVAPWELLKFYLTSRGNPGSMQEFWNSKMGYVHTEEGAAVVDQDLSDCQGSHSSGPQEGDNMITMGIDVGKSYIHVEIVSWYTDHSSTAHDINESSVARVLLATKVKEFSELDYLMTHYKVNYAVIDAGPEYRMSRQFCNRWYGISKACYFTSGSTSKTDITSADDTVVVTVHRTMWIDRALSRFKTDNKKIALPLDTPLEYKDQIKSLVRMYKRNDQTGEMTARYVSGGDDHYGLARTYCEIALSLAAGKGVNEDISSY